LHSVANDQSESIRRQCTSLANPLYRGPIEPSGSPNLPPHVRVV
jgi:hypothetical protein